MERIYAHECGIAALNGSPALFVDGVALPAAAYISYLEERARYADFAGAGYRLYSLPVFFAGRGINTDSGIYPLRRGIFDEPDKPYWEQLDAELDAIIAACPNTLIFPRVNMMMPEWWEREHPGELNRLADGSGCRESFSSEIWRDDLKSLLGIFLDRMAKTKYTANIIGYHIADGMTEEWFHFGYARGGRGECAEAGYRKFLREKYPDEDSEKAEIPDFSAYDGKKYKIDDQNTARFCEYTNYTVARAICGTAAFVKEKTRGEVLVGTFYGYTLELCDARIGSHALKKVLECPDIDFISSPLSYMTGRAPGADIPFMSVYDSQRLHGKLYMSENDCRTYLSKYLSESRPNSCPEGSYLSPIWLGPPDKETTRGVLANAFARGLTHGAGFWWFDMWGGWYADKELMEDMAAFLRISGEAMSAPDRQCAAQYAVIASEEAYRYTDPAFHGVAEQNSQIRAALGYTGAPYDIYDVYDLDIMPEKYKAVIFLGISGAEEKALSFAEKHPDKHFLFTGEENYKQRARSKNISFSGYSPSADELKAFLAASGVHMYINTSDIAHAGCGYIALHAAEAGNKSIKLPQTSDITPIYPHSLPSFQSNEINEYFSQYETRIYKITP